MSAGVKYISPLAHFEHGPGRGYDKRQIMVVLEDSCEAGGETVTGDCFTLDKAEALALIAALAASGNP